MVQRSYGLFCKFLVDLGEGKCKGSLLSLIMEKAFELNNPIIGGVVLMQCGINSFTDYL